MTHEGYDIIGDVHGCADELERLLHNMGYQEVDGAWRHPDRQAVFVGDFIDRGPHQLRAVAIPKAMVEAGNALAVIGNHEFNAASLGSKDHSGKWNRDHTERNLDQSAVFLDAARFGSANHHEILDWFKTLPVWLDLDGIRVVHACWHPSSMKVLQPLLSPAGSLTDELIIKANIRGSAAYNAVEVVLKGPEAELDGYSYKDKDGHSRSSGRVTWWDPEATTLQNGIRLAADWSIFDPEGQQVEHLPNAPLPEWVRGITPTDVDRSPVCFGHYWFTVGAQDESLSVIDAKSACVDFSAVRGGPLVAYQWSGESELTSDNLITS